jgi:putative tricarboxylic transport membrane protein
MKFNDAITGAALFALAVFIGVYGYLLPPMPGQPYGAGAFPITIAIGLGTFSLVLVVQALRRRQAGTRLVELAPWARNPAQLFNFVATLALICIYLLFSERVGFIPLSIAMLMVLFALQRVPPVRGFVIAVSASLILHFLFAQVLRVPLPLGLLTDLIW